MAETNGSGGSTPSQDPRYIQPFQPAGAGDPASVRADAETQAYPNATAPARRKRRRGLVLGISLLVVIVVLVVGFFVAENVARNYADTYVKERITETLTVENPDNISVDLGGGSIIFQAISGSIADARVTVPKVSVGDLTGNAVATATSIPLDSTKAVGTLRIGFTVPEGNLGELTKSLGGDVQLDVTLKDGTVQIASDLKVLSAVIPIAVGLEPSAKDGNLVFAPTSFEINGNTISADDLKTGPLSGITGNFVKDQTVCVASYLPKALVLEQVRVTDSALSITLNGDGAVLGGTDLSAKGTCPA